MKLAVQYRCIRQNIKNITAYDNNTVNTKQVYSKYNVSIF